MHHDRRTYRCYTSTRRLVSFVVSVRETDMLISACRNLSGEARDAAARARLEIETYIAEHPGFYNSLEPLSHDSHAPALVRRMLAAASATGVGPMAAVAGAVAEYTGYELLKHSREVIVENGGDIFLKTDSPVTVGLFAGSSPLSERIGIIITETGVPVSLCTSSGTVGPSLSFGTADAVTVKSSDAALADAAATAIGNMVSGDDDIGTAADAAGKIPGIQGVLIIRGDRLGAWGSMELTSLQRT